MAEIMAEIVEIMVEQGWGGHKSIHHTSRVRPIPLYPPTETNTKPKCGVYFCGSN